MCQCLPDTDLAHLHKIHSKHIFLLSCYYSWSPQSDVLSPPSKSPEPLANILSCTYFMPWTRINTAHYSSAGFSRFQVRLSSSWNPSHNKAQCFTDGHCCTNVQKMERLLRASLGKITSQESKSNLRGPLIWKEPQKECVTKVNVFRVEERLTKAWEDWEGPSQPENVKLNPGRLPG